MGATESASDILRAKLQVRPPSEAVEWINLLVYGEPGAGKTWLAGSAADSPLTSPVLFLDVEAGVTTIRHRDNIDVVPIRKMSELESTHKTLFESINKDGTGMYYRTVVIDSLTELTDVDMRMIMRDAYNSNPNQDIDVPSPREWGKTRNHMRTIVRAFRDLPCHVIFTAGMGTTQDEGQPTKYHPGFSGKLRQEIPGFMDIVGLLTAEIDRTTQEKTRKLQVASTRRVVAKDRTSALGDIVVNPTIPIMWDMIVNSSVSPVA